MSNTSRADGQGFLDPIPGILKRFTINILVGAGGAGKSRMLASWWDRWERGATINGYPTNRPTGMFWLFADRTWEEDGAEIFKAFGRTEKDVAHLNLADTIIEDKEKFANVAFKLFLRLLTKLNPCPGAIVYVDPIILFVSGNPNQMRDVAWALMDFRRVCQQRKITIIATHYYSKQKAGNGDHYVRPVDRGAGSGAFVGFAHTVMYLEEPNKDHPFYLFGWRPRHRAEETFKFRMDNQTGTFHPYDEVSAQAADVPLSEPAVQLYSLIPDTDIDTTTLFAQATERFGLKKTQWYEYLKELGESRVLKTFKKVRRRNPS